MKWKLYGTVILIGALSVGLILWRMNVSLKNFRESIGKPTTVVIQRPSVTKEILKEVQSKPSIIERIVTRELPPDTVFIGDSLPESDSTTGLTYGISSLEKSGRKLSLSVWSFSERRGQQHEYTLPDAESDFHVRSGDNPATVRTDRFTGIRVGGDIRLFVPLVSEGTQTSVSAQLRGPIELRVRALSVAPGATFDTNNGVGAGVSAQWRF